MHDLLDSMEMEGTLENFGLKKHDVPDIVDRAQSIQGSTLKTSMHGEGAIFFAIRKMSADRAKPIATPSAKSVPKPSKDDQTRDRTDSAGRKLKHDRYYGSNTGSAASSIIRRKVLPKSAQRMLDKGEEWGSKLSDLGKF